MAIESLPVVPQRPRRSVLFPLGWALLILPVLGVSRRLDAFASTLAPSATKVLLFLLTDGIRLSFFIGVMFIILGGLRNRRWR